MQREEEWKTQSREERSGILPSSDSVFCPVQIPAVMLDSGHVANWDVLAAPASSERCYRESTAGVLINSNPEHEITLTDSLFIHFKLNHSFFPVKLRSCVSLVPVWSWSKDQTIVGVPKEM